MMGTATILLIKMTVCSRRIGTEIENPDNQFDIASLSRTVTTQIKWFALRNTMLVWQSLIS